MTPPLNNYQFYPGHDKLFGLKGRTVALTGVTGGIGHHIAKGLVAHGAHVALIGRNEQTIAEIVDELNQIREGHCSYYLANLENEAELRAACKAALAWQGRIDVLVNSAGFMLEGKWEDLSYEFEFLYKVNVIAPFILCQEFAESLVENGGQVVFINSSSVQTVAPEKTPYTASKFAMKGLADSFRVEFNKKGVRTLSVYPGRTATGLQKRLHEGRGEPWLPETLSQPEDVAGIVIHLIQMPRSSEVTEIFIRPNANWGVRGGKP